MASLVIIREESSRDRSIGGGSITRTVIPESELVPGKYIYLSTHYGFVNGEEVKADTGLTVRELTPSELTFIYQGESYVLNREWQVLGTTWSSVSSGPGISVNERFTFHFEAGEVHRRMDKRVLKISEEAQKNADKGDCWKNIPLLRELIHILKDLTPLRDQNFNPYIRSLICRRVVEGDYLDDRETPRLVQSFLEMRHIAAREILPEDEADEKMLLLDPSWDSLAHYLAWAVCPGLSYSNWLQVCGRRYHLSFDRVQHSQEWEDCIYEVEKACEKRLKGVPRGMGFCFQYWGAKREELSRRGIQWKSPSACNPRVLFD